MNRFADILNGLSAEERLKLITEASYFLQRRGDYDTCLFCGKQLTDLVCDAPLGYRWRGDVARSDVGKLTRRIGHDSEAFTCDLQVCESCRVQGSPRFFCDGGDVMFFCGGSPRICDFEGETGVFIPDLCPLHAHSDGFSRPHGIVALLPDEVTAWRRKAIELIQSGLAISEIAAYPEVDRSDVRRAIEARS